MKIRSSDNHFEIYQETSQVFIQSILMATMAIGFGGLFVYFGPDNTFPLVLGGVFIVAGVLIMLGLLKKYKKITRDGGVVMLQAGQQGLSLAPVLNMPPVNYAWSNVSRMILAKKIISKDSDGTGYSWNQLMVFFRPDNKEPLNFIQRNKQQLSKSPKGEDLTFIALPNGERDRIRDELTRWASNGIEIQAYSRVILDYNKALEVYEP